MNPFLQVHLPNLQSEFAMGQSVPLTHSLSKKTINMQNNATIIQAPILGEDFRKGDSEQTNIWKNIAL